MARPIPGEGSIINRRRALTASRLQRIERYSMERGKLGQPVRPIDLVRELDVSNGTVAAKLLVKLEAQGKLERLALRDGWLWRDPNAAPPSCTLDDLLARARACTSTDAVPRKGRQADDVNRDVRFLTPAQLEDIERLAVLIRRHTTEATPPVWLQPTDFVWDETLDDGRGGWALQRKVRTWAEADHRAAHEARSNSRQWNPKLAAATVSKHRGAVNNLLFLAATHGRIPRSPRNAGGASNIYYPAWTPVIERWTRWIVVHAGARDDARVKIGAKRLAQYASRLGYSDVVNADWSAVRDAIVSDHEARCLTRNAFESARYAYRMALAGLVKRLGDRLPPIEHERLAWRIAADDRITLVPQSAIDAAGVAAVGMAARDFSGWRMPDGRYPAGLIESAYGVRAWAAWSTLPTSQLQLQTPALPKRVWKNEPRSRTRRRKNRYPRRVSSATLSTRLRMLAHLAGFAATVLGTDWERADLQTLCDPQLIDAYLAWSEERPADGRGDRHAMLRHTVLTIAWLINGFLQARSAQQLADAERAGDTAAAAAVRDRIERFTGWYRMLEERVGEMPEPRHLKAEEVAAHIVAIAEAWRGSDQSDGLHKIDRLVDCLVHAAVAEAGGLSVDEQYARIQAGTFEPTDAWARTIRLATLLIVLQRIPLRGGTCSRMTLGAWQNMAVAGDQFQPSPQLWEGAIWLEIPVLSMKARRPFRPALILPRDVGAPEAERGLRREILRLWFCEGGARDYCRTALDPETGERIRYNVDWLFPDLLRDPEPRRTSTLGRRMQVKRSLLRTKQGGTGSEDGTPFGQWKRSAISNAFRSSVIEHARALCVDIRHLKRVHGALRIHTVRRLFGSYWAPKQLIETSRLLHHRDPAFTAARYCAQDERTMSLYF